MATAQKRGFHFPWDSEPRTDESESTTSSASLNQRLAGAEDLGRGPFDLAQTEETGAAAQAGVEPAVDARKGAAPDVEPNVAAAPADQEPADAPKAPDAAPATAAPSPPARSAWPEADQKANRPAAGAPRPAATTPTPSSAVLPPRRANPLVAGLVRAMRDAARVARDEQVAALRSDAGTRGEAIRARSTVTTLDLRRTADTDVAGIREWSKAEMARLREETESRIAARKSQLISETEAEAEAAKTLLGKLAASVQAFEAEAAAFFDALLAEDDPARLAGLAERMPQPPTLDEFPADDNPAPTPRTRAPRAPSAAGRPATHKAVAKLRPTVEVPAVDEPVAVAPALEESPAVEEQGLLEDEADLANEPVLADEPLDAEAAVEVEPTPDALDAEAAAAAEAEALLGLDGQTQLIVSGLVSVGGIAAFKAGIMRSRGVSAVSVTAGTDGDFVFSVTHDGDAQVRDALRDMDAFEARVVADDGDSLVVVAHESAA
jgi:hypothetical protein